METTFYLFGVLYLRWTNENGVTFEAVKEQVDLFGKEFFEQEFEEICEETDTEPDGITFNPTEEEIIKSTEAWLKWLREQEIC